MAPSAMPVKFFAVSGGSFFRQRETKTMLSTRIEVHMHRVFSTNFLPAELVPSRESLLEGLAIGYPFEHLGRDVRRGIGGPRDK